ncbi:MAG: MerR family transcriptional regulator, partial [Clostridiales bacterium]|nr:MerR family transcriptional regulator [Clostridiales bacterium]
MENGYRDYTRSDLDTLHKIRLLRALGLGIDEIRKLSAGETALGEALESRLSAMQTEQRMLVRAEEVARAMLRAHADYATLDTGLYLAALEAGAQTAVQQDVQQDVQPKLHAPWRRFFARMIDLLLYDLTWMVILTSAGLCAAGNRGVTLL